MSRTIFALIRHGDYHQLPHTPSAHQPFALTAQGIEQAKQCGLQLQQYCNHHQLILQPQLLCSHLLRAWQTAEQIRQVLRDELEIVEHRALAERAVGTAANLSLQQIEECLATDPRFPSPPKDWKSNSHYCLPFAGAESLLDSGKRVAKLLSDHMHKLSEINSNATLQIIVGHGAAIRHAAYHLGLIQFEQIAQLSMYHCQPVYIGLDDANQWQHVDGDWKIRTPSATPLLD